MNRSIRPGSRPWEQGPGPGPRRESGEVRPSPSWAAGLTGPIGEDPDPEPEITEPVAVEMSPRPPAPPVKESHVRSRRALWLSLGGLGFVGMVVAGAVLVFRPSAGGDETLVDGMATMLTTTPESSSAPETSAAVESAPAVDPAACAESNEPGTWAGRRPGGSANSVDAIFGFQHAYYVERSAAAARMLTAPDAAVGSVEKLQAGIDTIPAGTTHCLRITETAPEIYRVVLTQRTPGLPADVWVQTVRTQNEGGRTLIASIKGEG
ncbi:hypothetical protein GS481_02745 [Rhodococcus hoagii]|nr:hypothetical protein [Prescottella equi]